MMPMDLRHYQQQPRDDDGAGVIVWLAIGLAFIIGVMMGAM